jgi:hypothetical protein
VREQNCTAPHRVKEMELFCTPHAVRCPSRERCDVPYQICMRDNAPRPPQPQPAPREAPPQPSQGDARPAPAPAEPLQAAPAQPSPPPPPAVPVQRASPPQSVTGDAAMLAALRPHDGNRAPWGVLAKKRKLDDPSTCYSGINIAIARSIGDKPLEYGGFWINGFGPNYDSTDTAGQRSGLRLGDQIFGIDGMTVNGMSGEEVEVRSDKPVWDPLRLLLRREGERELREVTVSCANR